MKRGKFNCIVDSAHGSSAKGAASCRLVDIYSVPNISSCNFPNAGHCQTADTYIVTNNGLETIGDVVNRKTAVSAVNMYGEDEPISAFIFDGVRKINRINLANGSIFRCTDIHRYFVWDSKLGVKSWVRSLDLDPNRHQFILPKSPKFPNNSLFTTDFVSIKKPNKTSLSLPNNDVDFAKVLGLLVGDGYYADHSKVDIAFHSSQLDTLSFVKSVLANMGVTNIPSYKIDGKDCEVLSLTQVADFHAILDMCGLTKTIKNNKTTPKAVLKSNKNVIAGYLSGLFDSDGCAKSDRVTLSNCSESVIKEAQQLLYVLGIHSCITKYLDVPGRTGSNRLPQYMLSISGKMNMATFARYVGFICKVKQDRLITCIDDTEDQGQIIYLSDALKNCLSFYRGKSTKNSRVSYINSLPKTPELKEIQNVCEHYHIVDIDSIAREDSEEEVYDITMPNTHSYLANGCISHNTARQGDKVFISKAMPTPAFLNMIDKSKPRAWIGPNSGFFLDQLTKECEQTGYKWEDVVFHERAVQVTDRHIAMESPGGLQSTEYISSTMSGSGAAYAEKAMRRPEVKTIRDNEMYDTKKPMEFMKMVRQELHNGRTFMHEVSQGFALSVNHGTHYPTCTFRDCTSQQAWADFCLTPELIGDVYLNVRSFPIRVGNNYRDGKQVGYSGDFVDDQVETSWEQIARDAEMPSEEAAALAERERTTVTKKIRRVATQSWRLLADSATSTGASKLILNFPQYIHWSAYKVRGGPKEFRNLHYKVREYVAKMEDTTNLKVCMIGTSAEHNDFIWLD